MEFILPEKIYNPINVSYNYKSVESDWVELWEKCFVADNKSNDPPFVMVLPPPNVTGSLHLGHALTVSIQDAIVRFKRMHGYQVCWVPGVDHAGIATQVVVEKKLMPTTRHDLGRENFLNRVWEWKNEYGNRITNQLRQMGVSVDWSRECFTMDEKLSAAVNQAFIKLYNENLIYRSTRLVNWCCILKTALSDQEVVEEEIKGKKYITVPGYKDSQVFGVMYSFAYKLVETETETGVEALKEIIVSTTRPETLFGDVAVAVNSQDSRYKSIIGRKLIHPFIPKRHLVIIADDILVDMSVGSGAVKITPAHDANDYQCGIRHDLDLINIFTEEGLLNSECGEFQGLPRFTARKAVIDKLKEYGLFRGESNHATTIFRCSRSNDIIEPIIKPQWYIKCDSMARQALDAVHDGDLEIIPKEHEKTWNRWLENIHDWCISRQLWWGHRIPAYEIKSCNGKPIPDHIDKWVVASSETEAKNIAATRLGFNEANESHESHESLENLVIEQDTDVLDTWFSSSLFPFSVFGWPNETLDFQKFYPNSIIETGYDILFFWVARMVMIGKQLTGQLPFKKILLHSLVRDCRGRKMSKSLGNVIDPLDVIHGITLDDMKARLHLGNLNTNEIDLASKDLSHDFPNGIPACGTDALRFALVSYTIQTGDINLDILRIVGYRGFCNKIWNVFKFAQPILFENTVTVTATATATATATPNLNINKWILSRMNCTIAKITNHLENYNLGEASSAIYSFWYNDLCDVYIEAIKNEKLEKLEIKNTFYQVLENGLILLHPFMPFITEELWQRLKLAGFTPTSSPTTSIMLAKWPIVNEQFDNPIIEKQVVIINEIISAIRSCKNFKNNHFVINTTTTDFQFIKEYHDMIMSITRIKTLIFDSCIDSRFERQGINNINIELYIRRDDENAKNENAKNENAKNENENENENAEKIKKMEKYLSTLISKNVSDKVPENIKKINNEKIAETEKLLKLLKGKTQ